MMAKNDRVGNDQIVRREASEENHRNSNMKNSTDADYGMYLMSEGASRLVSPSVKETTSDQYRSISEVTQATRGFQPKAADCEPGSPGEGFDADTIGRGPNGSIHDIAYPADPTVFPGEPDASKSRR